VIYSKFDPAVKQQREALRSVAARRTQFHSRLHSHGVNVLEAGRAWVDRYGWLGRLIGFLIVGAGAVAIVIVLWSFLALILGVALMPSPKIVNVFVGGR